MEEEEEEMKNQEACAHLRVSYRTEVKDGITHGWWECDSGCGTRFLMSFEKHEKPLSQDFLRAMERIEYNIPEPVEERNENLLREKNPAENS